MQLYNGNGYDDAWVKEAEKRGLLNLVSTVDALPLLKSEKNIALFEKQKRPRYYEYRKLFLRRFNQGKNR